MKTVKKVKTLVLDALFPPVCLNCRAALVEDAEKKNLLCKTCSESIPVYKTTFIKGGIPLMAVSSYENDALKNLIHYFKYESFLALSEPIRELISRYLKNLDLKQSASGNIAVLPIPLHKVRMRRRGFNQSQIVAKILAEELNAPLINILQRTRNTAQQIHIKDRDERRKNVRGSFSIMGGAAHFGNTKIILVDDVYTSGATIKEAVRTLKKAGAKEITAFVLAKAE
jgi:ComF family protein